MNLTDLKVNKLNLNLLEMANRTGILESKINNLSTAEMGIRYTLSTDIVTRIGGAVGKVANANGGLNDFDNIMPWAGMRRCNLADNLAVNAYYGDANYKEDGSNGQVMVEVPAFYYRRYFEDADNLVTYISMNPLYGYKLHPWFYTKLGVARTKAYFSAYEGSVFDVSAAAYLLADEQVTDFAVTTGDKLCSRAGAKPCSGKTQALTLPNSRKLANNRGWEQQHFNAVSAIQMLLTVEYASLKSQAVIGQGVVNVADVPNTENNSVVTGATSALGNKSGKAVGTDGLVSISYRGIENFWGNIWKWVDGINISNGVSYISNKNGDFLSDVFTGQYVSAGFTNANVNGYVSKVGLNGNFDYGFLPTEALGTSSGKYADYFYQNSSGSFVARLGGYWCFGAYAGAFGWSLSSGSGIAIRYIGARLCA